MAKKYFKPLDDAYRGRLIFDLRNDDTIFISIAAFRETLLSQTLKSAFDQAEFPNKVYVGAIVQNCFGTDQEPCKIKDKDVPPDPNGIQEFCSDPTYKQYCDNNQIRVIYLQEKDALGPTVARYYASKLWGGEAFFMQLDSHLLFSSQWDTKYIAELKSTKSFPKSILSSYPPKESFDNSGEHPGAYTATKRGTRLCKCEFVEHHMVRINTSTRGSGNEPFPSQIPFIAAGFFFATAKFLMEVPFDPYLPGVFMGEEIHLAMRAWTHGWNIYAPRHNLLAHQYRASKGFPHFGTSKLNNAMQKWVIRRIKHIVGYPTDTQELIKASGHGIVLDEIEHYSLGTTRSREEYFHLTNINLSKFQCPKHMQWCAKGKLE